MGLLNILMKKRQETVSAKFLTIFLAFFFVRIFLSLYVVDAKFRLLEHSNVISVFPNKGERTAC